MPKDTVLSVSQLNRYIKSLFEQNLQLKDIFVRGEISNFKGQYASGHFYFTLKDKDAAVKAVMFRNFASRVHFYAGKRHDGIGSGRGRCIRSRWCVSDILP